MQLVRKFGQGKRRFSLDRVMAKLDNTSQTALAIVLLVMNLSTRLRRVCVFLCRSGKITLVFGLTISKIISGATRCCQNLSLTLLELPIAPALGFP